jgi:hypothetical protein
MLSSYYRLQQLASAWALQALAYTGPMDPHSHGTLQSFSLQAFNEAVARCDVKILDPLIAKHPKLRDIQDIVHGDTLLHLMAESSIASWVKWALDKGSM